MGPPASLASGSSGSSNEVGPRAHRGGEEADAGLAGRAVSAGRELRRSRGLGQRGRLARLDASDGKDTGEWKWESANNDARLSHLFRNFILGGYVDGKPVLITAQGTYKEAASLEYRHAKALGYAHQR